MPEALKASLPHFEEAFLEQGIASLSFPGLEADDVIATLASKVASRGSAVVILSTDKAFLQLLSDRIQVRDHFQQRLLDRAFVIDKYGVEPEQFVDFLALTGESTNNIQGVPGIGRKTAATLLRQYGTLDQVCCASGAIKGKLGESLRKHTEDVRMSQTLVCLRKDLELGLNLKSFRLRGKKDLS
jgi:protein Xni